MIVNKYNTNIRDYGEGLGIQIEENDEGTLFAVAHNQAGYDSTALDVEDTIKWVAEHKPNLIKKVLEETTRNRKGSTSILNEAIQWGATVQPSIFTRDILNIISGS